MLLQLCTSQHQCTMLLQLSTSQPQFTTQPQWSTSLPQPMSHLMMSQLSTNTDMLLLTTTMALTLPKMRAEMAMPPLASTVLLSLMVAPRLLPTVLVMPTLVMLLMLSTREKPTTSHTTQLQLSRPTQLQLTMPKTSLYDNLFDR